MSIESWKAEFYSTDARMYGGLDKSPGTTVFAILHSLQKWRGLTKENLRKHDLSRVNGRLFDGVSRDWDKGFLINDRSCALCHMFYVNDDFDHPRPPARCGSCPLRIEQGIPCDVDNDLGSITSVSPFRWFILTGDPQPMINLLERALRSANQEKP